MPATRDRNDLVFPAFIGAERVAVCEAYVFFDRDAPAECLLLRAPATLPRLPAKRDVWSKSCVNGAVYFNRLRCMADVPCSVRRPWPTEIERGPPWQRVCGRKMACMNERAR